MRQPIYEDAEWTLEVDPACSREETWDGFTIFEKSGLQTCAVVHCGQPFDAEHVVRDRITVGGLSEVQEISYEALKGGLAGAISIVRSRAAVRVTAVASSHGQIAQLTFKLLNDAFLSEALSIWRSLRYEPPEYARLCGGADPPLADLLAKLEGEHLLQDAVAEIRHRRQVSEGLAVLLAALRCDCHLVRRNACEALGLLNERTPAVLSGLRAVVGDPSGEIGAWACEALADLGEPPESVAGALVEIITRPERPPNPAAPLRHRAGRLWGPDRSHAARVLRYLGEAARPYHEILERYRHDAFGPMRLFIAQILLNLGEPLGSVTGPLYQAVADASMDLAERSRVASWLLDNGDPVPETAERLRAIEADYQARCNRDD
jgi:hypothetical protein